MRRALPLLLLTLLPGVLPAQEFDRLAPLGPVGSEASRSRLFERIGAEVVGRDTRPSAFRFADQELPVRRGEGFTARPGPRVFLVESIEALRRRLEKARVELGTLPAHPPGEPTLRVEGPEGLVLLFRSAEEQARAAQPVTGRFNPIVLEVLREYPADGTHPYHWPRSGGWRGSTRDLVYGDGEIISKGDPQGRAYCCGLTFEVFVEAWRRWAARQGRPFRVGDRDVQAMRKLQSDWFGSAADISCLHTAIVGGGLGTRITELEKARAGDFVQLWRHSGSGHSVIFLGWERRGGRITGLRYWSTQKSTEGIGERVERFGKKGSRLDVEKLWICRVGL